MIKFIKNNFILISLLTVSFLVFFYTYWNDVFRPGAIAPNGWYGLWSDQKRYYEEAQAILGLHLDKSTFRYPILYPLLGAIFIKFIPRDPFFLINAFLFLVTISFTYLLVKKAFNEEKAIFAVVILLCINRFVYDFVTPWSTSLTAPLFLIVFYVIYTKKPSIKYLVLISGLTILATFARYLDFVFFLPLLMAFILKNNQNLVKTKLRYTSILGIIVLLFISLNYLLNFLISGSILGAYAQKAFTVYPVDIAPLTVFEKLFGYFFNPFTFHRQIEFFSTPALVSFPIMLIFLAYLIFLLVEIKKEKNDLKITHLSILLSFIFWVIIYIPIGTVSPFVLKVLNLHYIKPWYPVFLFYLILIIDNLLKKKAVDNFTLKFFFSGLLVLILIPVVIQKVQPKLLINKDWKIEASASQKSAQNMLDHNLLSYWDSNTPRKKGDSIIIDMKTKHLVSRLQMIDELPYAATNFDTLLSADGKNWQKLAPNYSFNVRLESGWDILGYMRSARYIKIVLNETSLTNPWHIKEIYVFGY